MVKRLIVSADDYGYTKAINCGIEKSVEKGIVSCINVLVKGKYFKGAKRVLRISSKVQLGIHLLPRKNFDTQLDRFTDSIGVKPGFAALHWSSKYKSLLKEDSSKLAFTLKVFSKKHGIYLRGTKSDKNFVFYAEKTPEETVGKLISIVGRLVPGTNELVVHPGAYPDEELDSKYTAILRRNETEALTSKEVLNKLKSENIQLANYGVFRR